MAKTGAANPPAPESGGAPQRVHRPATALPAQQFSDLIGQESRRPRPGQPPLQSNRGRSCLSLHRARGRRANLDRSHSRQGSPTARKGTERRTPCWRSATCAAASPTARTWDVSKLDAAKQSRHRRGPGPSRSNVPVTSRSAAASKIYIHRRSSHADARGLQRAAFSKRWRKPPATRQIHLRHGRKCRRFPRGRSCRAGQALRLSSGIGSGPDRCAPARGIVKAEGSGSRR